MSDQAVPGGRRSGSVLGAYVLHEEIGRGGMGVVYRAKRADNGLEVALKLMLPELSSNVRFRERFITEAQTAPKLNHPNIVPVREAGEVHSELYIAMHLVNGLDLKQVIQREGKLAPRRVVDILRQAGAALDYAHGTGVVHRDVKPQNILVSAGDEGPGDHIYITDFGLTRPVGAESTASRTSGVFGSIQYMSPEQIEGLRTDGRADAYSLGCIAFEALTGSIPFDRANEIAVLWAHVHEDPPRVTDIDRDLPGGLDIAIATALAKHPDDRYLTCGEFVEALELGLSKSKRSITMPVVRPLIGRVPRKKTEREVWSPNFFPELSRVRKESNKPNWARVAAFIAAMLLIPFSLVQLTHPQGLTGAAEDLVGAADSLVEAVTDPGSEVDLSSSETAESETGETETDRKGNGRRKEGSLDQAISVPTNQAKPDGGAVPGSETPHVIEANVPSDEIVFVGGRGFDSELYKTVPTGTGVKRLTENDIWESYPSWSPDGRLIAFSSYDADGVSKIWILRRNGRARVLLNLGVSEAIEHASLSWSPDGKRIVYSFGSQGIFVVDLESRTKERITGGTDPEWSPDGETVVFSSGALWLMNPDGSERRRLTEPTDPNPGHSEPTWSPDGTQIVFTGNGAGVFAAGRSVSNDTIFVIDSDGTDLRRISGGLGERQPSLSPSGDQLVYVKGRYEYGHGELYLIGLDGSGERRLTSEGNYYSDPDWSWPDS
ncbi:MAG: protein kinase domain-containing protein [Actinomycetota bacterium]